MNSKRFLAAFGFSVVLIAGSVNTPAYAAIRDKAMPRVVSTSPTAGSQAVNPGDSLTVKFSEPMRTAGSVSLNAGGRRVPVNVVLDSTKTLVTITPGANLPFSTDFTAVISNARDLANNSMTSYTWSFKTMNEPQQPPKGIIALTFDDGPGKATPYVLDILKANNVKATFFLNGSHIAGNEAVVKRMFDEGHVIGNHSWNHIDFADVSANTDGIATGAPMSYADAKKSITDTAAAIKSVTNLNYCSSVNNTAGCIPMLFRYPYGDESANGNQVIREEGMWGGVLWHWTVNPEGRGRQNANGTWSTPFEGDWDCKNTSSQSSNYVSMNAIDQAVILLHDAGDEAGLCKNSHWDYLKTLIPSLKAQGWAFGVVDIAFEPSPTNQQTWIKVVEVLPASVA